jgi:hypothetical protein
LFFGRVKKMNNVWKWHCLMSMVIYVFALEVL